MWVTILKFAGEKLGKAVAEQLITEFGGSDAARLKSALLGKDDGKVKEYLATIDRRLIELTAIVKNGELRDIFAAYNTADRDLSLLRKAFEAYIDQPADDPDRQNACRKVLSDVGAFFQGRRMIEALCHVNKPNSRSFLQDYSDILLRDLVDVYGYCDRMTALVDHLKISLLGAATLRALCRADIADPKKIKDSQIHVREIAAVDEHAGEIMRPAREVRALFDRLAATGDQVLLQHCVGGTYLSGYEQGVQLSEDRPFGSYRDSILTNADRHGMPQVFLHERALGQIRTYRRSSSGPGRTGGSTRETQVTLEPAVQQWRVVKKDEGGDTVILLVQAKSGRALDGIKEGRVYLGPFDRATRSLWWQPVLTRNDAGQYDSGHFMLKHQADGSGLEADGLHAHAKNQSADHRNSAMRWRFDEATDTLGPAQCLYPDGKVTSKNGRYSLHYRTDGELAIVDNERQKVRWHAGTAGNPAWRCWMQGDDGNLVVYAEEKKPVWSKGIYGPAYAGSHAVLRDDGMLVAVKPDGEIAWKV